MLWISERYDRISEYAAKAGLLSDGASVAMMDSTAPVVADDERNNFDLDAIITTDAVDLAGEVVNPEGGDWSYLDTVKSVFVDHDPTVASTVGVMRFRSPIMQGAKLKGWRARIRLDRGKELARDCMALAKMGVLHASIGVIAHNRGKPTPDEKAMYDNPIRKVSSVIRKWRALEITLTAAPMNDDCRVNPAGYVTKSLARVRAALDSGAISQGTAAALGVDVSSKVVAGFHGGYTWTKRHVARQ